MVRSGKRIQPTEEQLTALGNYTDITVPSHTGGDRSKLQNLPVGEV